VSGVSLLVAALGVVTMLFGVVDVALPGSVRSAGGGGRGGVVRIVRGMDDKGGGSIQIPGNEGGMPMIGRRPRMRLDVGSESSGPVRSRGLVTLLRGAILALVAGAVFRYHWPLATEAPPEPAPPAPRRRRAAGE
jgi:hypothetical protein